MKKQKLFNINFKKVLSKIPVNVKHYIQFILISCGVIGLFVLGYWLMSLLDKNNPSHTQNQSAHQPILSKSSNSIYHNYRDFNYTLVGQVNFKKSNVTLGKIINDIVEYNKLKKLPIDALSITLINTITGEKVDYQGDVLRYPASVVKLFWLVTAYQKISQGELDEKSIRPAIEQMIYKSDNQGASQVIDAVTHTKSTPEKLSEAELLVGKQKRQQLNIFFRQAGYSENINVSQKTFPIPQENIIDPKGFDQQLRGEDLLKPIRNKITTNDAARLMYEIVNAQSISPEISKKMRDMLTRNINPEFWKKQPPNPIDFNPVESFFGEGLPADKAENIVSKAGWTSASRQEVAFIKSKDGKTRYILAIFADNAAYGKSKKIFPEISDLVYKQMRKL